MASNSGASSIPAFRTRVANGYIIECPSGRVRSDLQRPRPVTALKTARGAHWFEHLSPRFERHPQLMSKFRFQHKPGCYSNFFRINSSERLGLTTNSLIPSPITSRVSLKACITGSSSVPAFSGCA